LHAYGYNLIACKDKQACIKPFIQSCILTELLGKKRTSYKKAWLYAMLIVCYLSDILLFSETPIASTISN